MKHVFKAGGAWKDQDGFEYTVKCVSGDQYNELLSNGYHKTLELAKTTISIIDNHDTENDMSDEERIARDRIKELGGTIGGRAKLETVLAKLAELEAAAQEAE
jgi:predicted peptidase